MDRLEQLVDLFVESNTNEDSSLKDKRLLKQALTREILDVAKERASKEEERKLKARLQTLEKEERARLKQRRIAELIISAIILAFLVGLIVNQTTNLLEQIRSGMAWGEVIFPLACILVLSLIVILFLVLQIGIKLGHREEIDDE